MPIPFQITNLRPASYGRTIAEFELRTPGAIIACNVVADHEGEPAFIGMQRIRDYYSRQLRATAKLDRDFGMIVFNAVLPLLHEMRGAQ